MESRNAATKSAGCIVVLIALASCARSPQQKAAAYLQRGQAQMARRDYPRAILEFQNALKAMPADAEAAYQLGLAFLSAGNQAGAASAFQQATRINPQHSGAQVKLAELMAASRKRKFVEQAASQLEAVLARSPADLEAIDALAVTDVELGKPEDAQKRLEEVLEKDPAHLPASFALARIRLRTRDYAGAERYLRDAVANSPGSVPAALALGEFYLTRRQPGKAEPLIRKVLQLDPRSAGGLASLGAIQIHTKQWQDADSTYALLATLPPKSNRPVHAIFLLQTGHIPDALREWETLVQADPSDRATRSRLVSLYVQLSKPQQALSVLAAALKRNPKDTDALFQRSAVLQKAGKLEEAAADLKQVLHFEPDSVQAHLALADILRLQGLQSLANSEMTTALRFQPDRLETRLYLARNLARANQLKAALALLEEAPRSQQESPELVANRVWLLLMSEDSKSAEEVLDQALQAARAPQLVLQKAILRLQEHEYTGARLNAEEALKADPTDELAARIIVGSYVGQHQEAKALERLKEMVAARPQAPGLRHLLGEWYVDNGDLGNARKAFEAAKAADPKFVQADLALAEVDMRQKRFDEAQRRLTAIMAADPRNVSAWLLLAETKSAAGDRPGSVAAYRSVLAVDSSNFVALNNLAYELAFDDTNEALALAQQAAQLAPDDPDAEDTLGWVYYRRGSYPTAATYLEAAAQKRPTPQRQYHLAMCYLKSGQSELGQRTLVAALQKAPDLMRTERDW